MKDADKHSSHCYATVSQSSASIKAEKLDKTYFQTTIRRICAIYQAVENYNLPSRLACLAHIK